MKSKPILIAIAAFAVTATGVSAFSGTKVFERAGLSQEQISAFEVARELRQSGDLKGARDVLVEAGVDEQVLKTVHQIAKETRQAIHEALEAEDYDAFKDAIAGTPLEDVIETEADFKKFVEAHELKQVGKWPEAKVLLDELGIEPEHRFTGHHRGMFKHEFDELTDEQREAVRVARQANDRDAVEAILKEAGVEYRGHRGM
jgi:hypothetical protein